MTCIFIERGWVVDEPDLWLRRKHDDTTAKQPTAMTDRYEIERAKS